MARDVMMSDVLRLAGLDAFNSLLSTAIANVQYVGQGSVLVRDLAEKYHLSEADVKYQLERVLKDLCGKIAKIKMGRKV